MMGGAGASPVMVLKFGYPAIGRPWIVWKYSVSALVSAESRFAKTGRSRRSPEAGGGRVCGSVRTAPLGGGGGGGGAPSRGRCGCSGPR
jgi:hypothetical protein